MKFLFTGTRELLKGMYPIFDTLAHILGRKIKEKKRRTIEFPRYVSPAEGMRATKKALGDHRRRMARTRFGRYF